MCNCIPAHAAGQLLEPGIGGSESPAVAATNAAAIRAFLGCMLLIMLCVTLGMSSAHFTAIYLLFIVGVPVYMKRR
jgi:hypothetical protein